MKVILNKDIPNLGEEGEIKNVARGYARNYLIPQQLVMPYTPEALAILESRREQLSQRREEKKKNALDVKTRLETESLVLEMPAGDRGRLFGSVTSATIVEALSAKGISIERKRLEIPEKTIKSIGTTRVRVRLYGEEEAELKVVVRASGAQAPEEAPQASDEPTTEAPSTDDAVAVAEASSTDDAVAAAEASSTDEAVAAAEAPSTDDDAGEDPSPESPDD